jgi:hypothetical protein
VRKWLYAAAGLLVILGMAILNRPAKAAVKAKAKRDELILDGSGRAKADAHQAGIIADKHQKNAGLAGDAGRKAMDKAGKNESTADLLDSWRKPIDGL